MDYVCFVSLTNSTYIIDALSSNKLFYSINIIFFEIFIRHVRFVRLNVESLLARRGLHYKYALKSLTKSCLRGKLVSLIWYSHALFSNTLDN